MHRLVAELLDQALVAELEPVDVLDAVLFTQPDDDRPDGVVGAGAQPAAGDDPALQRVRIEEDPLSRPGQLERRRLDTGLHAPAQLIDVVAVQHPFVGIDEPGVAQGEGTVLPQGRRP